MQLLLLFMSRILNMLRDILADAKRGINILIALNILAYTHIFYLYYHLDNMVGENVLIDKNIVVTFIIGNFLLYLFLFLTSFIFMKTDAYIIFRKKGILDWVIRLLAYIVVYQYHNFDVGTKLNHIVIFTLVTFLLLNLALEFWMYHKAQNSTFYPVKKSPVKKAPITEEEMKNIPILEQHVATGVLSAFLFVGLVIGFSINIASAGDDVLRKILMALVSLSAFLVFVSITYKKFKFFYTDKKVMYKKLVKNLSFLTFGYVLCILEGFTLLGSSEYIYDIVLIIAVLTIVPFYKSNQQMAKRLKTIKDKVNENDFYF